MCDSLVKATDVSVCHVSINLSSRSFSKEASYRYADDSIRIHISHRAGNKRHRERKINRISEEPEIHRSLITRFEVEFSKGVAIIGVDGETDAWAPTRRGPGADGPR